MRGARSIDRKLVEEFCRQARGRLVTVPSSGSNGQWSRATLCNATAVAMLQAWITGDFGIQPSGRRCMLASVVLNRMAYPQISAHARAAVLRVVVLRCILEFWMHAYYAGSRTLA